MKAIMLMFDTLNLRYLPCYGNDWVIAPNSRRLAERTVLFDHSYVGSMPCMPARRELHTGRYNLLHRSWGPLEPFDDSLPQLLAAHGVYSHLVSDHQHYWEDGGATYHQRYSTWNNIRGQEGDRWKAVVGATTAANDDLRVQDKVNRRYLTRECDQPQSRTMAEALEFLETNHGADDWFLHVETFDPHEPFFTQSHYKDLYPDNYEGPDLDWPNYGPVTEPLEQVQRCRRNYAALLTMCDRNLGLLLDTMDRHDLWHDTMLIVNTDHGFLLGEHDWWAKCVMPFYEEVAHTPLFIWDPRTAQAGKRRDALVQTIDLAPTILDLFDVPVPPDMQGRPLAETIAHGTPVRQAGLFGIHGGHVNVTDGRYVYMRGPVQTDNSPLFEYTLMPTHMRSLFSAEELRDATLHPPFGFTKGVPVLRIPARQPQNRDLLSRDLATRLYDLQADPRQEHPLEDAAAENYMTEHLVRLMRENEAPPEQYERLVLRP
jgi:arylsulfatase A-like enzyme